MTQAKKEAFLKKVEDNSINTDAVKIYRFIKTGQKTLPMIESYLGKSFNQFTGRITDLLDIGLITETPGDKYSIFTAVTDPNLSKDLAEIRRLKKYNAWIKQGKKFLDLMPNDIKIFFE